MPNMSPRPRRPGASQETLERLRLLHEQNRRVKGEQRQVADELHLAVLEACELEGATHQQIAAALEVGTSTVHGWIEHGRQLREG